MDIFEDIINGIEQVEQKQMFIAILAWMQEHYPTLDKRISYGQPTYTSHGTFIISFSLFKHHMTVNTEKPVIEALQPILADYPYEVKNMVVKIKNGQEIKFDLINMIIEKQLRDKKDWPKYWRKLN